MRRNHLAYKNWEQRLIFPHRSSPIIHFSPNEVYEGFGPHPFNLVQQYCDSFLMSGLGALAHSTENEQNAYSKTQTHSQLAWHLLSTL